MEHGSQMMDWTSGRRIRIVNVSFGDERFSGLELEQGMQIKFLVQDIQEGKLQFVEEEM